jgi:phosphoglycerate dehydrogenase-like enzyme
VSARRPAAMLAYAPERNPDTLPAEQRARLESLVTLLRAEPVRDFADGDARAHFDELEVLITGWGAPRVTRDVLDAMPRLRLIAHLAGSVKEIVDPWAFERGIAVVTAADANAIPVAEYTLAAILFANKRVLQLRELYRRHRRSLKPLRDHAPGLGNHRKTIGIVGASRIGRRVLALLAPFDFDVLVYDPHLAHDEAARLGARAVDLDTLVASSDVVSLHAPATGETHHLLDARRLGLLRDGATVINTARASLIDQAALIAELQSGRIDAILDVTDPEPLPPDSPLYELPNVVLTPHVAGAAGGEVDRLVTLVLDELARYANGEPLQHAQRPEMWELQA